MDVDRLDHPTGLAEVLSRRQLALGAASVLLVGPRAHAADPGRAYHRTWRSWTDKLVVYRNFGTVMLVRATLLEPEFRNALADERHRLLGEADTGDEVFRDQMQRDGTEFHEFVLGADWGLNGRPRFGEGDDRWNLRLEVDGTPAPLHRAEHIRRPTPVHEALYPQLDQWNQLWIARFTRVSNRPKKVQLHVGSGYGNGTLEWNL